MEKTLEQIETILRSRINATHKSAKKYDEGDHWQDGAGFLPFAYMDAEEAAQSKKRIELGLVAENVTAKIIDNEQNGLLGREPDWGLVEKAEATSDAEKERNEKLKSLIESANVQDWNDRAAIQLFREAYRVTATQETVAVRAYLPPGYVENGVIKKQSTLLDAMKMWQFEVISADAAGVFSDEKFCKPYGIFIAESEGVKTIEISAVDDKGLTRLRKIKSTTGQADARETLPSLLKYIASDETTVSDAKPIDLGGNILIFEINSKALINAPMISNQKAVNLNHTMKGRGTFQNGHRDAFALNAQPPMEETVVKVNGEETIVETPTDIVLGGGSTNFLNGAPVYKRTANGEPELVGYANASVQIVEPIDPENFIKGEESEAAAMYRQASQEHLTISESATVAGKSKEESRVSFEKKLTNLKPTFDAFGRWYLTVKTYLAAASCNEISVEDMKKFRFDFNCIVDAGTPSAEIIASAQDDVEKGRLSLETFLSSYRKIEDVDAEMARLQESEPFKLANLKLRYEVAKAAKDLGLPESEWIMTIYPGDEAKQAEVLNSLNPDNGLSE